MRLGVIMGMSRNWKASIEKAKIAEDLGYEFITAARPGDVRDSLADTHRCEHLSGQDRHLDPQLLLAHPGEAQASRKTWADRDKAGAMAAISDDMLREIQLIGPAESCREQLQERAAQGAELQLIYAPQGDPASVAKQLEVLVR